MTQVKVKCRICGVEGEASIPDGHSVAENTAICHLCERAERILILGMREQLEEFGDVPDRHIILRLRERREGRERAK